MPHNSHARRWQVSITVGAALAALFVGPGLTLISDSASAAPAHPASPRAAAAGVSSPKLTARQQAMVPRRTERAELLGNTKAYASSTSDTVEQVVPDNWYGRISVLPVIAHAHGRVKVRLPRRPNESTAWVARRKVFISHTRYAILIDTTTRRLYAFRDKVQTGSYPVGVGTPQDFTPTGTFFLAFHSAPPDPGYGPEVLNTSAHSTAIKYFGGGSDAIIAIHGPIGEDAEIGSNGAAISHGCVRMHDSELDKIRHFPKATPVIITS